MLENLLKPDDPDLIPLTQTADLLGISRKAAEQWRVEGRLPAVRSKWNWWVSRDELEDMLQQNYGVGIPASGNGQAPANDQGEQKADQKLSETQVEKLVR